VSPPSLRYGAASRNSGLKDHNPFAIICRVKAGFCATRSQKSVRKTDCFTLSMVETLY
jgi:hypothetical protein